MKVVVGVPPIFDRIDAVFHVAGQDVLFAFGDVIFNPAGRPVPDHLVAHEAAHGRRQLEYVDPETGRAGVEAWWDRYLVDAAFRFEEELVACAEELRTLLRADKQRWVSERAKRRTYAGPIVRRLSGPLYGRIVKPEHARKRLLDEIQKAA